MPAGWCEAHHVIPWKPDGETNLDNLHLECSFHHHRVHAGDLVVHMIDRKPKFFLPDGRELVDPRAGPPRTRPEILRPAPASEEVPP